MRMAIFRKRELLYVLRYGVFCWYSSALIEVPRKPTESTEMARYKSVSKTTEAFGALDRESKTLGANGAVQGSNRTVKKPEASGHEKKHAYCGIRGTVTLRGSITAL